MAYNPNKIARLKDIITLAERIQDLIDVERTRIDDIENCLQSIQSIASTEITLPSS